MWPKPSAKSFGLKRSATEAEAEGQKISALAEDLQPSVDPWLLHRFVNFTVAGFWKIHDQEPSSRKSKAKQDKWEAYLNTLTDIYHHIADF